MNGVQNSSPEKIMHSLRVISRLSRFQRLSTVGKTITIQPQEETFFRYIQQVVCRTLNGDSREKNIHDVENIVDGAFKQLDYLLEEREKIIKNQMKDSQSRIIFDQAMQNKQMVTHFQNLLKESSNGLQEWKCTYENDPCITARIDLLIQSINDKLSRLTSSLEFLQQKRKKKKESS